MSEIKGYQSKIVTPNTGVTLEQCKLAVEQAGGQVVKELKLINSLVCKFPIDLDVNIALSKRDSNIKVFDDITFKTCLLNRIGWFFPPRPPMQPPSRQQVDWGVERIGALKAWNFTSEKEYVRVGIIDTGIDVNHPDLRSNIRKGINTLDGGSIRDDNGHGTHVAGIVAALNNNFGTVGVAPTADLYIVKAFDKDGSANLGDIVEGLEWCIDNKVQVVNMSFSSAQTNEVFYRAIRATAEAGVIMVAAAGNEGKAESVNYPAKYSETIAVSAINKNDQIASFSSSGVEINITAPGDEIRSTYLRGGYKNLSGTSMAAPHVTGAIALALKENPKLSLKEVRQLLNHTTERLARLGQREQGAGLVRADFLVSRIKGK